MRKNRSVSKRIGERTENGARPFCAQSRLIKVSVEAALGAKIEEHLGYDPYASSGRNSGSSRNGRTKKRLKDNFGEVEISTPRDIVAVFKELYSADVSHILISRVTDDVIDEVQTWQESPWTISTRFLFGRHRGQSPSGINSEGQKTLLGLWLSKNEGEKFWLSVLTELKNLGLKDIFTAYVDGLTGFPDAIQTVYPQAKVQLCTVHMVRNSLKHVAERTSIQAGHIVFSVRNEGPVDRHEFVIFKTDLLPDALPADAEGVDEKRAGLTLIGEIEGLVVGAVPKAILFELAPENYVLICNIWDASEQESHSQKGMWVRFTVTQSGAGIS